MLSGQHFIQDTGSVWKYYAPMLHMDDDDLDPYEYRLLGHYRRVCGKGGVCTESAETTAAKTKMSAGKVSQTRRRLETLQRITITTTRTGVIIRLVDCWAANHARYAKPSAGEGPLQVVKAEAVKPSAGEGTHATALQVVKQRKSKQPILKQRNNQIEHLEAGADAPAATHFPSEPLKPVVSAAATEPATLPDPTEIKRTEQAAAWALHEDGGTLGTDYVSKVAQQLSAAPSASGAFARYALNVPANAQEIVAWGLWLRKRCGSNLELLDKFKPRKCETIQRSFTRFRADSSYSAFVCRAGDEMDVLLKGHSADAPRINWEELASVEGWTPAEDSDPVLAAAKRQRAAQLATIPPALHETWRTLKTFMATQMNAQVYQENMQRAELYYMDDNGVLVIGVTNTLSRDMCQHRLMSSISRMAAFIAGRELPLRFEVLPPLEAMALVNR